MSRLYRLAPLAALLAGCGYDPTYYQLVAVPGAAQAGGPSTVEVRSVSFPVALDRDQIVTASGYALTLDKRAAWGDSPGLQICRTLAADLAQRLPGSTVFAQNTAVATDPAAVVELDVDTFSGDGTGQVVLAGSLDVHRVGGASTAVPIRLSMPAGPGAAAMVPALSTLLGQVADRVGLRLRELPPTMSTSTGPEADAASDAMPGSTSSPVLPPGVQALSGAR